MIYRNKDGKIIDSEQLAVDILKFQAEQKKLGPLNCNHANGMMIEEGLGDCNSFYKCLDCGKEFRGLRG